MNSHTAVPLPGERLALGEGPNWEAGTGLLWWVDIPSGRVFNMAEGGAAVCRHRLAGQVGMAIPAEGGGWVAAAGERILFLKEGQGEAEEVARVRHARPDVAWNDGKCDARGRLLVGSRTTDWSRPGVCALYRIHGRGEVETLVEGLTCSNGIDWSPDGRVLYHVDSFQRSVCAWDYDPDSGAMSGQRQEVAIPPDWGLPDGMCADAEGRLWIACFGGGRVVCWNPQTRAFEAEVRLDVPRVSSCTFGGKDLSTLFITTAVGLPEWGQDEHPHAGLLHAARPGARGMRAWRFRRA